MQLISQIGLLRHTKESKAENKAITSTSLRDKVECPHYPKNH